MHMARSCPWLQLSFTSKATSARSISVQPKIVMLESWLDQVTAAGAERP